MAREGDRGGRIGEPGEARGKAQGEVRRMDVPVYNTKGDEIATLSIDEQSLGGTVNAALIKQAYVMYHANLRQGSSRTKNRHDVEGSTKKIYKQKGTGRARHGDRKVPQFRGGGHAFAKRRTREDYHLSMPTKMRRKANRNALLAKLVDNEVRVVDDLAFAEPKTRSFVDLLGALKVDRSALVALSGDREGQRNAALSARNIDVVTLCRSDQLTCFNMLNHRYLVIGRRELESWLNGPSSQTGKSAKVEPMGRAKAGGEAKR
ncbi:MAG: 50S ribosomal protein L4 [Phycisphaeraceae bacterium]|nr:50S ribosomal protein L4 [Phycisphaeraceae bacterium]